MDFEANGAVGDGECLISLTNVSKRFGTLLVLSHVNLQISKHDCIKIEGESGAGKTTLLRVLMGLETEDSGMVQRKQNVCFSAVFQEDRLLMQHNVADNLRLVHHDEKQMQSITQALGLDVTDAKPVCELSGGQRRRVALARALIAPSDILVLDEPFTGLDDENVQRAKRVISTFRDSRALVLASHIDDGAWLPFRRIAL